MNLPAEEKELIDDLERMVNYLHLKVQKRDWHGVADAAMDIREIEAKLELVRKLNSD